MLHTCPSARKKNPSQEAKKRHRRADPAGAAPEPWMFSNIEPITNWHVASCIETWADRMNDENKCVSYLAAKYSLAEDKPKKSPTLQDLREDCAGFREHIDVDFLQALCSASNKAMEATWKKYGR